MRQFCELHLGPSLLNVFLTKGISNSTLELDISLGYFKASPTSKSQLPLNHPVLQAEDKAISPEFQAIQPGAIFTKQWLFQVGSKKSHLVVW